MCWLTSLVNDFAGLLAFPQVIIPWIIFSLQIEQRQTCRSFQRLGKSFRCLKVPITLELEGF